MRGLEEREVIRTLGAGEALRLSDTRLALLVKKGDAVVISVGRPGAVQVSAAMTALESGRVGEQIKVRNNESGRVVEGIVTGKHTVKGL